jgi:hypothetical protein
LSLPYIISKYFFIIKIYMTQSNAEAEAIIASRLNKLHKKNNSEFCSFIWA